MSQPALNPEQLTLSERVQWGELAEGCPRSRQVFAHLTSLWGVLCLLSLQHGTTLRFGVLRRRIQGVSEKMLAQTLKKLEGDGFVKRIAYPVIPPHVEYSLTPLGEEAAQHVAALADWVEVNLHRIGIGPE